MELRDYQWELLARTRAALREHQRVICQAPTGSGKTALAVYMMRRASEAGRRTLFVVHRHELLQQTSEALWQQQVPHGLVAANRRHSPLLAQVASVQTLVRRLERYDAPDLIVIDEAHRAAAATYRRVLEAYPRAHVVGLTATPERTDGTGLDDLFGAIVEGPSIRWLIDQGWLADYRAYAPGSANLEGVHSRAGDYVRGEAEAAIDKPAITGDAVSHYRRIALGKRAIVFAVSRRHARHIADRFVADGIAAEAVTGDTDDATRRKALERFREGTTWVLVGVDLFIEGLDVPSAEVAILLRPTQSTIVHMQSLGRVMRADAGKDHAIILDHVGNLWRHGLPDDEREWSLAGRKAKSSGDDEAPAIRQCPQCYHVHRPAATCPACGFVYETQPREVEERDGELVELDAEAIKRERKRAQAKARTLEDLVSLGVERGMKDPGGWAAHVLAAREGRKATHDEKNNGRRLAREVA